MSVGVAVRFHVTPLSCEVMIQAGLCSQAACRNQTIGMEPEITSDDWIACALRSFRGLGVDLGYYDHVPVALTVEDRIVTVVEA